MYCPSCGKQIPEASIYCLYCGKPVDPTQPVKAVSRPKVTEWEYKDFVLQWNPGTGGYYPGGNGSDPSAGLILSRQAWFDKQSFILPKIQVWLDDGWEPITEVGPAALSFRRSIGCLDVLTFTFNSCEIEEFRVKMRRPKQIT